MQLSKSIALDYAADGVRCNCICPGITDTPMFREHMDKAPGDGPVGLVGDGSDLDAACVLAAVSPTCCCRRTVLFVAVTR